MSDFHPEWLADLGPWHPVGDTPFLARCLPSAPDGAILILRPWGPWAAQRWRAVFSPPDRDDDGQDWRHGEIGSPDGGYWPNRESAEAALDAAWSAWRERYAAQGRDVRRLRAVEAEAEILFRAAIETYGEHPARWLADQIRAARQREDEALSALSAAEAERDELRLALAAELGDAQGAPSARWTCDGRTWYAARSDGGTDKIECWSILCGDGTIKHTRGWMEADRLGFERERGRFKMAREAMMAADAEQETP